MNAPLDVIESFIKAKMLAHKGKKNAIKRKVLLLYVHEFVDPEVVLRQMSKAYERLPLCGTTAGLYVPGNEKERAGQIRRNESWIRSLARKNRALKKLNIPPQPIQKELFNERNYC